MSTLAGLHRKLKRALAKKAKETTEKVLGLGRYAAGGSW